MDTDFLKSFLVFAESGSLREASHKLGITPAALSQRLHSLESSVGAKLIARSGQKTRPTRAGLAVLAHARQLLRDIDQLRAIARDDSSAGRLTLGAISTAITGMLPHAIAALARLYPELEVHIIPGTSIDLYQQVLNGDLDAAIMVEPPFDLPKAGQWLALRTEPLLLITPSSMKERSPQKLLSSESFVRYDRRHWGGRIADQFLQHLKIVPRDRFELDALDAIAIMVSKGLGVSLVPDWAPPWPEGLSLNRYPIGIPAYDRRIGLLSLRSCPNQHLLRLLQTQLRGLKS